MLLLLLGCFYGSIREGLIASADVTWRDAKTGEKIENIDEELKKMEASIAELEEILASM